MASVRRKCKMEDFGDELGIILKAYEADLNDELKKDIRACGRLALKEVKVPPEGAEKYHSWADYNKGWHSKTEEKFGIFSIRIRNTEKPGLTHLLEKGHVVHTKRLTGWRGATNAAQDSGQIDDQLDGKRFSKRFPHIARAAKIASMELTRRIHEKQGRLK